MVITDRAPGSVVTDLQTTFTICVTVDKSQTYNNNYCHSFKVFMPAPGIIHQLAWPHHERRCNSFTHRSTRSCCHNRQPLFGYVVRLADGVPDHDTFKLQSTWRLYVVLSANGTVAWSTRNRCIDHLHRDIGKIPGRSMEEGRFATGSWKSDATTLAGCALTTTSNDKHQTFWSVTYTTRQ